DVLEVQVAAAQHVEDGEVAAELPVDGLGRGQRVDGVPAGGDELLVAVAGAGQYRPGGEVEDPVPAQPAEQGLRARLGVDAARFADEAGGAAAVDHGVDESDGARPGVVVGAAGLDREVLPDGGGAEEGAGDVVGVAGQPEEEFLGGLRQHPGVLGQPPAQDGEVPVEVVVPGGVGEPGGQVAGVVAGAGARGQVDLGV